MLLPVLLKMQVMGAIEDKESLSYDFPMERMRSFTIFMLFCKLVFLVMQIQK
jgi:hypothetical protein